jgi:hypothetical protein
MLCPSSHPTYYVGCQYISLDGHEQVKSVYPAWILAKMDFSGFWRTPKIIPPSPPALNNPMGSIEKHAVADLNRLSLFWPF